MKTEEMQLIDDIIDYWEKCAYRDSESDFKVNNLIYNYALSIGIKQELIENRVDITVMNMTNSQKRKLKQMLYESNIL